MACDPRSLDPYKRRKLTARLLDEEGVCWLCGKPVDRELAGVFVMTRRGKRALHPMAPVLDEILPVAYGGDPYDIDNIHLAHNHCNLYRGKRMDVKNVQRELREGGKARIKPVPSRKW